MSGPLSNQKQPTKSLDLTDSEVHNANNNGKAWEWRVKYERLFEAHRKLQKTNNSLEDKLLRIVDKFEAEKNQMTRDLASQTQRLVESKLTIQRLHDQNCSLQSDLNLSINLLRNRPNCFVAQRIDSLPSDVRASVKSYTSEKNREKSEGKKIRVAIPDDVSGPGFCGTDSEADGNVVSAAILAKVLEERDKERQRDRKFCIDVGTQTHGWHFPAGKSSSKSGNTIISSSSTGSGATPSKSSSTSSQSSSPSSPVPALTLDKDSSSLVNNLTPTQNQFQPIKEPTEAKPKSKGNGTLQRPNSVCINGGGILFTSVIHTGGGRQIDGDESRINALPHSLSLNHSMQSSKLTLPISPRMTQSITCSALQTDI